jgi:hypothetical protein
MHLCARDFGDWRQPALIHQQVVFAAESAAIGRISACVLAISGRRHTSGINASSTPHDLVVLTAPSQNRFVDTLPDIGLHPLMKPTPACHATAASSSRGRYSHGIPVLRTLPRPQVSDF